MFSDTSNAALRRSIAVLTVTALTVAACQGEADVDESAERSPVAAEMARSEISDAARTPEALVVATSTTTTTTLPPSTTTVSEPSVAEVPPTGTAVGDVLVLDVAGIVPSTDPTVIAGSAELQQGADPIEFLSGWFPIEGRDPSVIVAGAPIVGVDIEVDDPVTDPTTGERAVGGVEFGYQFVVETTGMTEMAGGELVRDSITDLLVAAHPDREIDEFSDLEDLDYGPSFTVVVQSGYPQSTVVNVRRSFLVEEQQDPMQFDVSVRRYVENPPVDLVPSQDGSVADVLGPQLALLADLGESTVESYRIEAYASPSGESFGRVSANIGYQVASGEYDAFEARLGDVVAPGGYVAEDFDDFVFYDHEDTSRIDSFYAIDFTDRGAVTVVVNSDNAPI